MSVERVGRYALHGVLAVGGMATVHLGRLMGPVGFSRTVAVKRMHPQFAGDPQFVAMFLDEARLAARIQHPNVVPTIDVVATGREIFLVMEFVRGESLAKLLRRVVERRKIVPARVALGILHGVLEGLHAAHEARDERGAPLGIVHRDVSPQNVLVGADGIARVLDFGVAKAAGRSQQTSEGQLKGKLSYMSPEQLEGNVSPQTDVFAASIVLWETLTGRRLFQGENEGETLKKVMLAEIKPPSRYVSDLSPSIDALVMKGLARDPRQRWMTAREMSLAIAEAGKAEPHEIAAWLETVAKDILDARAERVAEAESQPSTLTFATTQTTLPDRRRRLRRALWIALGAAAVIGGALTVSFARRTKPEIVTPSAPSTTSAPIITPAAADSPAPASASIASAPPPVASSAPAPTSTIVHRSGATASAKPSATTAPDHL
jgi:serine/threonine-protein kinase